MFGGDVVVGCRNGVGFENWSYYAGLQTRPLILLHLFILEPSLCKNERFSRPDALPRS